jgi:hypothetical protein
LKVVDNVERLPDNIRAQLVDWFQAERPYSSIYDFLTDAGYQVSRERIKDWNKQLLKRLKLQADKELSSEKTNNKVAKEFESQALKGLMEFFWAPFDTPIVLPFLYGIMPRFCHCVIFLQALRVGRSTFCPQECLRGEPM